MNNPLASKLRGPVFILLLAGIGLFVIESVWAEGDLWYKLAGPCALAVVGLISLFINLTKVKASPPSTDTDTQDKATTEKPAKPSVVSANSKGSGLEFIMNLVLCIVILGGGIWFVSWCVNGIMKNSVELAEHGQKEVRVITSPLPIGHNYDYVDDKTFDTYIKPGIIYNVFEIKKGQRWKWYFQKNILFRVKSSGDEVFSPLKRHPKSGTTFEAYQTGLLQIKSSQPSNHVRIIRLASTND